LTTVSAVIPVYNRADTLRDAVESVLFQDFSVSEIIVVDDGSDTPAAEALKAYKGLVKIISFPENRGVSAARNAGIMEAQSDFVAFLDSDDIWLPFKISEQLELMKKEGTSVCHTNELWYKKDRFINQGSKHGRYGGQIFPLILDICRISDSSLIVKKEIFRKTGIFDERMRVCEDYDLFLRIASLYEISYSARKCIIKRSVTGDQLSASIRHIESARLVSLAKFTKCRSGLKLSLKKHAVAELERKFKIVESGMKNSKY
jgi:glycosyltransferase involved in cell wall biosynthesis